MSLWFPFICSSRLIAFYSSFSFYYQFFNLLIPFRLFTFFHFVFCSFLLSTLIHFFLSLTHFIFSLLFESKPLHQPSSPSCDTTFLALYLLTLVLLIYDTPLMFDDRHEIVCQQDLAAIVYRALSKNVTLSY